VSGMMLRKLDHPRGYAFVKSWPLVSVKQIFSVFGGMSLSASTQILLLALVVNGFEPGISVYRLGASTFSLESTCVVFPCLALASKALPTRSCLSLALLPPRRLACLLSVVSGKKTSVC